MTLKTVSENRCFEGVQYVFSHQSGATGCEMTFAAYIPDRARREKLPVLYYLSGVTCTHENFTVKAGAQRHAAEHGLILVVPDTSPRGEDIHDEDSEYIGTGAGFYVNATREPWKPHYRMYDYVVDELPGLVAGNLPVDDGRQGVFGHSMGGHGALVVGLRNPEKFRTLSALAAMCAPSEIEFGKSVFSAYLGDDTSEWEQYDATRLVLSGCKAGGPILIDQGDVDSFYVGGNMKPEGLVEACRETGQAIELRMREGYDHSYFYVATFVGEHIKFHAAQLCA